MQIKLLAIDIDETLVRPAATQISAQNIHAIDKARQAGVRVTLATGRIYSTAQRWVEMLHIDMPVIASNGADIRQDHASIFTDNLDDVLLRNIMHTAQELDVNKYLFSGDYVYCTPQDRDEELFAKWYDARTQTSPVMIQPDYETIYGITRNNVQKALLWAKTADGFHEAMRAMQRYTDECGVVSGESLNIEINKLGVTKAAALRRIVQSYNISMEEVMAIGDNGNDVDMLRSVGYGVAMQNATPEATAAARYTTGSCDEHGVAQAIQRFIPGT